MKHLRWLVTIAFSWMLLAPAAIAQEQFSSKFDDAFGDTPSTFMTGEQAFTFEFSQQNDNLIVSFNIKQGYYLYKKQFTFIAKNATTGAPTYPVSEKVEDEYYGSSEVFREQISIVIPIIESTDTGAVEIRYQGCADGGLCYNPMFKTAFLSAVTKKDNIPVDALPPQTENSGADDTSRSQQYTLADRLISKESLFVTMALFLALGVGLGFTPCVFPMYPIVSGIVIGQAKDIKTSTALWLTFIYVQGMAITYSILGLVVASAGMQFQAALQHPVVLSAFIVVFVLLALAMFGRFELQLPGKWQTKLTNLSNNQTRGNLIGIFIMGAISGLIASPCTTAPLTGILLFIAQSGDTTLGFISLYVLSVGMGIPLMIFGATGSKILPKAGHWMNVIKVSFGFMMLTVAILFVERLWPSEYVNLLWAALGLVAFHYYYAVNEPTRKGLAKYVRTMIISVGIFGSVLVGYQTLYPAIDNAHINNESHPEFITVKNSSELAMKVKEANAQGKNVMVDLYADWCVACKEFEKHTFPDPEVITALKDTVWVQIDLTDATDSNTLFQKEYDVLGLPTILFFDTNGKEMREARVTGFLRAYPFASHVKKALK